MPHFADRLTAAIRSKGNALCVGFDPRWDSLPESLRRRHGAGDLAAAARCVESFCLQVLDIVAPLVAVIKPQSAFFEAFGPPGMAVLQSLIRRGRDRGLVVVLDAKRNDIASTAQAYAEASFSGVTLDGRPQPIWDADALTVNPYLGRDAVEPFLECARKVECGVFILVRTSNRGAGLFQDLECAGRPLYLHVADAVRSWSRENLGRCGFGDVGAVVGATHPAELAAVREALPEAYFLIPGFGAQGGTAADTGPAFRPDGLGAFVNSSRGIVFPFRPMDADWEVKIEAATRHAIADLAAQTPMGRLETERT